MAPAGVIIECFLTNHDPVGEDEELDVGSEGTEHQAAGHHHAAEDGHGTSSEVVHAGTADGTWVGRAVNKAETKKRIRMWKRNTKNGQEKCLHSN